MNQYQKACYDNAKTLLRSSKLLFEKRQYGPSSALSVLTIEEFQEKIHKLLRTDKKFALEQAERVVRYFPKTHGRKIA